MSGRQVRRRRQGWEDVDGVGGVALMVLMIRREEGGATVVKQSNLWLCHYQGAREFPIFPSSFLQ